MNFNSNDDAGGIKLWIDVACVNQHRGDSKGDTSTGSHHKERLVIDLDDEEDSTGQLPAAVAATDGTVAVVTDMSLGRAW